MIKSIKKSAIHVQNPAEKIQVKQDEKPITSIKKSEILVLCVAVLGSYLVYKMIQSKPKRE
jgi:hypothetical protein